VDTTWDPRAERMSADERADLQATRLDALLGRLAERSPLYRERLATAGVGAGARLGLALWAEVCARALGCAGAGPGTLTHVAYGYGLFTGGFGLHGGAELMGCTVIPMSSGQSSRQVRLLRDLGAEVLCCTPSYAVRLGEVLGEEGRRAGGRTPVPQYLLVVDRTETLPRLVVACELAAGWTICAETEAAERSRVATEVGAALLQRLGLATEIRVLPFGVIPPGVPIGWACPQPPARHLVVDGGLEPSGGYGRLGSRAPQVPDP
jgi:hypothetical protein